MQRSEWLVKHFFCVYTIIIVRCSSGESYRSRVDRLFRVFTAVSNCFTNMFGASNYAYLVATHINEPSAL